MTASTALLAFFRGNLGSFFTVAELAAATGVSPSRVRELIPGIAGLVNQRTGKAFSFSIPAPVVADPAPVAKATRKLLNPQPVIAKKTAALAAAGAELTYAGRTWTITLRGETVKVLTSQDFAAMTADELVALLP